MSQELSPDDLQKIVDDHVARLLEHFDSVTILATSHDGSAGETTGSEGGGGDLYARLGRVREWLTVQDQYARNWASRKVGKSK